MIKTTFALDRGSNHHHAWIGRQLERRQGAVARVAAAKAKRARRAERNKRIAAAGGFRS